MGIDGPLRAWSTYRGLAYGLWLFFRVYDDPLPANVVAIIIGADPDGDFIELVIDDSGEAGQAGGRGIGHTCGSGWVYLPPGQIGGILKPALAFQLHEKPYHFWNPVVGWYGEIIGGFL